MILRSARVGVLASSLLAVAYAAVVWGASGSFGHLVSQVGDDWFLLLPIVTGFGIQAALFAELKARRRLGRVAAAAGGAGMGASTAGMVACCAHHIADLAPFLGATGAATFLTDYRVTFMIVGIGANPLGVWLAIRRLRGTATAPAEHGGGAQSWLHA